jgi:hypothetical protein
MTSGEAIKSRIEAAGSLNADYHGPTLLFLLRLS